MIQLIKPDLCFQNQLNKFDLTDNLVVEFFFFDILHLNDTECGDHLYVFMFIIGNKNKYVTDLIIIG